MIDVDIPLTEQNLKRETMVLLAILNLNYWCESENEKQEFLNELAQNENEKKELEEKYNPDNIFKKKQPLKDEENIQENMKMIEYKEKTLIRKILDRIMLFFKKNNKKG